MLESKISVFQMAVLFGSAVAQTIKPGCLPKVNGLDDLWCPGDNGYVCYKIPSL